MGRPALPIFGGKGGNGVGFFKIDLTTRYGAESAARSGSLGSFIAAGLTALAGAYAFVTGPFMGDMVIALGFGLVFFSEFLLFLMTGLRLRAGKGLVLGGAAIVLLIAQTLSQLASFGWMGLLIRFALLTSLIEGVRGAWALRRNNFVEDVAEAFN
jgi:hypothetical protein